MKIIKNAILCAALISTSTLLSSCGGGGGGGDDFIGAAEVVLQISPSRIDTGDRTEVKIEISRIHLNGIALKVRFPDGLTYVTGSSFLDVDDSEEDISPTVNQGKNGEIYLVYYITSDKLGEDERGSLFFELEGIDSVKDGVIEVDPDVDDPSIDNAVEFNIEEPQFGAEDEASIEVTE